MKYQEGYCNGTKGKPLRYPLDDEEQSLAQETPKAPVKKSVVLDNAHNVATKVDVRGEGPELGCQAGTYFKHHESVAYV